MPDPLTPFEKKIGYRFADINLLELALTHPSCDLNSGDNQRLEFLGDAVLDLVVAETLYRHHPDWDEGALDHMRASLVNGSALTTHARTLDLDSILKVSDAQRQHHPLPSSSMLEDAFEALIGAIYLDSGIESARQFILQTMGDAIRNAYCDDSPRNPKGQLQEWTQKHYAGTVPTYIALAEEGPDHARIYRAVVTVKGNELGRGQGRSKKSAESDAATHALKQLSD
jgi:ribonuclease-3